MNGWRDNGFTSKWYMKFYNYSPNATIILPIGKRVAQIAFFYTGVPMKTYASEGKYQTSDNIKEIMEKWTHEVLLPKLYKDK